jgi:hypothetical protein
VSVYVVWELPGVTEEQYLGAFRAVPEPADGADQEDGHLVHVGGPMDGGWRIVDVWETPEHLTALLPALKAAWASVGVAFPDPVFFPVRHLER